MNLEALKEKARRHEQKEEWKKALDAYREVILRQDDDEPPDITLYNRIGDIQTRLKQIDGAVDSYEKAIELYLEAELPNNAIAICKKVLRNLPDRTIFFLRMGQIRGTQGFLTDAKQNFLTYAERMTAQGDLDSALDALVELVELVPEDVDIRMALASQLESHERTQEAVEQYSEAYGHLIRQDREEEAETVSAKIRELDPDWVVPDPEALRSVAAGTTEKAPKDDLGFGGFELGSGIGEPEVGPEEVEFLETPEGPQEHLLDLDGGESREEEEGTEKEREPVGLEIEDVFGVTEPEGEVVEEEEEVEPLPTLSLDDEEDQLPTFGLEGEEEDLPFLSSSEDAESGSEGLPTLETDYEEAGEILRTFGVEEEDLAEAVPAAGDDLGDEGDEEESELPTFSFQDEDEEGEALPTFPFQEEEGDEKPAEEEPVPDFGFEAGFASESDVESEEALADALEEASFEAGFAELQEAEAEEEEAPGESRPIAAHEAAAERGDLDTALDLLRQQIEGSPDEVSLYQRQVEYAFRKGETSVLIPAYLDLANCLLRTDSPNKARAIFQQVLALSPGQENALAGLRELDGAPGPGQPAQVASSEEYVDLGSMILGEESEKTTRWQVTAESPSGDDQADFARMLSQFKQKVSENVDADDVSAHHDLGTAYLEMGLLDEAVSEFQMALRSSPNHLPTHEVMGRCWMEKGQPDMAVRALNRALDSDYEVEDELIGIYYIMGRAKEELGEIDEAVEFYEKVFSLDINFEDVTERLRSLR